MWYSSRGRKGMGRKIGKLIRIIAVLGMVLCLNSTILQAEENVNIADENPEVESPVELPKDETAPMIVLHTPKGFETWYNAEIVATITVTEDEMGEGIRRVTIYMNGKLKEEKLFEESGDRELCFESTIAEAGEFKVEAEDYAGNLQTEVVQVLLDNKKPEVMIEGIEHHMISGEGKEVVGRATDDKGVEILRGRIIWKNPEGIEEIMELNEQRREGGEQVLSYFLEEDGWYKIELEAIDQAGNQNATTMEVVIDKENPMIQNVEDLAGSILQNFVWSYPIEEVIQDFTSYTYQIDLDGRICRENEKYTEEGEHVLEVWAKDAAGNESKVSVKFVIDCTGPEVCFEGVRNQMEYEEQVEMGVHLQEDMDDIEAIYVNGEKIESGEKQQKLLFDQLGSYTVKVVAKDEAGNRTEEEMHFKVVEKKTFLEKIFTGNRTNEDTIGQASETHDIKEPTEEKEQLSSQLETTRSKRVEQEVNEIESTADKRVFYLALGGVAAILLALWGIRMVRKL